MAASEGQIKLKIGFCHHRQHFLKAGGWNTVLTKVKNCHAGKGFCGKEGWDP